MKRGTLVEIAAAVMVPRPALAHTVGGDSGVNFEIELLALGAVLVAGALAYRARTSANPIASSLVIGLGAALVVTSFIVPGNGDANAPAPATDAIVSVVRPKPGAKVPAREPIMVEAALTGGEIADDPLTAEGGHLHVFVDGVLQEMVFSTSTEVKLTPGRHTITVEYTDPQHRSFDPPVSDSIEVIAAK